MGWLHLSRANQSSAARSALSSRLRWPGHSGPIARPFGSAEDFPAVQESREFATKTLHLRPTGTWPTALDLLARVEIGVPPDPGPAAAAFLQALDPLEVERAALARMDLENVPGGGTAAVLGQLAEWALGA